MVNMAAIKFEEINIKEMFGGFIDKSTDIGLNFFTKLLIGIAILIVGLILIKLARKAVAKILGRKKVDPIVTKFLDSVVRVVGWLLIIGAVLSSVGVATASIMAVLGTAGLSLGLALQGALKNFAGGVLIMIRRPFKVNDYVKVQEAEGTVLKMDVIYTTLTTLDNKAVRIPNGVLMDSIITNYTRLDTRRVDIPIGIHYDDNIKLAKELAQNIMEKCEYKIDEPESMIVVKELADSSVTLEVRMWVNTPDYWDAKFELNEQIKEAYDANGITIAYNQLDVHLVNNDD